MQTFEYKFHELTGNYPFPWQTTLYQRFIAGEFPASANIPTGLGKTSVVAVWLLALADAPSVVPRRLVYVVNRRTVVDQTTSEAEQLRKALSKTELAQVRNALSDLCALPLPTPEVSPLAISTLRGQFADNGEWRTDPTRPAIVVGTVDMIGSGLLFSRYTAGCKTRPLHAGFLAQDTLLVHDEAHLEPAFQILLEEIEAEQKRCADFRSMRIMELTATSRSDTESSFTMLPDDHENKTIKKRVNAVKRLSFTAFEDPKELVGQIVARAKAISQALTERTILIFVRSVDNALKITDALDKHGNKGRVVALTGTMRGKERDDLVCNAVFQRFLPEKERFPDIVPAEGTVFLVATSAGEVGVNISADDCICDLSTYESMAQRFGRINRFGDRDDSNITVVWCRKKLRDVIKKRAEAKKAALKEVIKKNKKKGNVNNATFNELKLAALNTAKNNFARENAFELSHINTLFVMRKLPKVKSAMSVTYSASPAALATLPADERVAAFSPPPTLRIATEVQFDAWSLTSIRESIAARPPVAPYLHGEAEWQPPETYLAWRDDLDFNLAIKPDEFFEIFPLRSCELLRDTTKRIVATLKKMLKDKTEPVVTWLIAADGSIEVFKLSADYQNLEAKLAHATLILPESLGGLENGLFTGKGTVNDVSGINRDERDTPDSTADFTLEMLDQNTDEPYYQLWFAPVSSGSVGATDSKRSVTTLADHTLAVTANISAIAAKLNLAPAEYQAVVTAAKCHDYGKNNAQWQRSIGNRSYPAIVLAKSDRSSYAAYEHYRHEFGSLTQLTTDSNTCDLAAHIVGAHHGRSRPHFPTDEIFAPDCSPSEAQDIACTAPRRFAALQHKYGRWGLAYLESLLRAADYAASAGSVAPSGNTTASTINSTKMPTCSSTTAEPSVSLALDPLNPGHFFACCGLFELASRLVPEALAWFEQKDGQWYFHLAHTPTLDELINQLTTAKIIILDENDNHSAVEIEEPFSLVLDWWRYENLSTGRLKTWAGQMKASSILLSLQTSLKNIYSPEVPLFEQEDTPTDAVSYFDAPRALNAAAIDVGFSLDKLKKGGVTYVNVLNPAVEFLTLIGLQRSRPSVANLGRKEERLYDYWLWTKPLPIALMGASVIGKFPDRTIPYYRFTNPSRTKDYRAFRPANPIGDIP
jgi:CRISPR-associated endonuclease/helicase Cas3